MARGTVTGVSVECLLFCQESYKFTNRRSISLTSRPHLIGVIQERSAIYFALKMTLLKDEREHTGTQGHLSHKACSELLYESIHSLLSRHSANLVRGQ